MINMPGFVAQSMTHSQEVFFFICTRDTNCSTMFKKKTKKKTDSDTSGCSSELFPLIQRQVIDFTMTTQKQNSDFNVNWSRLTNSSTSVKMSSILKEWREAQTQQADKNQKKV